MITLAYSYFLWKGMWNASPKQENIVLLTYGNRDIVFRAETRLENWSISRLIRSFRCASISANHLQSAFYVRMNT